MIQQDAQTVADIQTQIMQATAPHLRGQHPKMHGCVAALFEVLPLPPPLDQGLFARPARFDALVRLSSGRERDDRKPDAHGMAIKLLGVAGEKAMPEAPEGEQDFILVDNPVFFIRNAADYARFMALVAADRKAEFLAYLHQTHPEDVAVLTSFAQHIQADPLSATYWGQVPYALGPDPATACRYRAVPRVPAPDDSPGATPDYLRERMVARLAPEASPVVYDLQVQLRQDADAAVIENPTVEWDTPFVTVGTLTIPPQEFDTPERRVRGEGLRFSPWHALAAHRPLGEINAVRRVVYPASQALRAASSGKAAS